MENILRKDYTVLTSVCDSQGKLGVRNIFDLFEDLASEHAYYLGVGYYQMLEHRCYWMTVRVKAKIYEQPWLGETVKAVSWPAHPHLVKCDRFYKLLRGDQVLAEGRTEWAGQNIDDGKIMKAEEYGYPVDMEHWPEKVCEEPYTRFRNIPVGPENLVGHYTVRSQDIDVGQHMNNVAYVRMLLETFTTEELVALQISEVELSYRRACFEGETVSIYRSLSENGYLFEVQRPDGETAVQALIRGKGQVV